MTEIRSEKFHIFHKYSIQLFLFRQENLESILRGYVCYNDIINASRIMYRIILKEELHIELHIFKYGKVTFGQNLVPSTSLFWT